MKTFLTITLICGIVLLIAMLIAFPIVYFKSISTEVEESEQEENAESLDDQLDR